MGTFTASDDVLENETCWVKYRHMMPSLPSASGMAPMYDYAIDPEYWAGQQFLSVQFLSFMRL